MRTYMDEPIKKETLAFGVGGQFVREDDFPDLPLRARVTFRAEADYENVKHKFLEKGGVEETLILTIDVSTFEVVDVEEHPTQEELDLTEAEAGVEAEELVDA